VRLLADTSVWADYLRLGSTGPSGALDERLAADSVLMCGPVIAELLAGTPDDRAEELWLALGSLPWAELDHEGWREVGRVARTLRRSGTTVPLTDIVIAVATVRAEVELWPTDTDFRRIGPALPDLVLRGF